MDETSTMIEDTFHRLRARPEVSAVVLMNREGQLVKSFVTSGQQLSDRYSSVISKLVTAIELSIDALDGKSPVSNKQTELMATGDDASLHANLVHLCCFALTNFRM